MTTSSTKTTPWSGTVLARSERSRDPMGFGGVIFSGFHVNDKGDKQSTQRIVVRCKARLLPGKDAVQSWEFWHVEGDAEEGFIEVNGVRIPEVRVEAARLHMVRHSGAIIVDILAHSSRFKGIGETKARELWSRFGERIYDILDTGCVEALAEVLTPAVAATVAEAWQLYAEGRFVAFLQNHGFPVSLARKVVEFYGKNAEALLLEDPYRLLAFSGSWAKVDALAQSVYGVALDAKVRLKAAIEEALYMGLNDKSTAADLKSLKERLHRVLHIPKQNDATNELIDKALAQGESNGAYLITPQGLYQAIGPFIMERTVADRLKNLINQPDPEPSLILSSAAADDIERLIGEFESKNGFALNREQREAVRLCVGNRFAIITGGAGTGKTTVLKCLYHVLKSLGYSAVQMALAGKAAKRMREATGMESHTIAGFLAKASDIIEAHGAHTYYVIDESSMLDLLTAYRIMKRLPDTVRMVMVGDPYQLPPIGPGLVFQKLVGLPKVPQVTLTEVKRQKDTTGIPTFAAEVRKRSWPAGDMTGVKFIECSDDEIMPTVLGLYVQDPERTQVICAVNSCSRAGVDTVNAACQAETNGKGRPIRVRGCNGHLCDIGIRENDRVIFTRNDWERGVMNGDIGTVIAAFDEPEEYFADVDPVVGMALVDGVELPVHLSDLDEEEPSLTLGYAITCHKGQGSQFPRVIVPIKNALGHEGNITSRILDLTWFYTAITRAEQEVILVGCRKTAERAVKMGSRWQERVVGLSLQGGAL